MDNAATVFISTGEPSGDFYGAQLAKCLWEIDPGLSILGIGSDEMRACGVNLLFDSTLWSAIGLLESICKGKYILPAFWKIRSFLRYNPVSLLVVIDFPSINFRLAKLAKQLNIPVVYYFPPSAWSSTGKVAKRVAEVADEIIVTFSFTEKIYKEAGVKCRFWGHPIADFDFSKVPSDPALESINLSSFSPVIGLFPGSRTQEIEDIFTVMLKACNIFYRQFPNSFFLLSLARPALYSQLKAKLNKNKLPIVIVKNPYQIMSKANFLLVTSGTITLEATLFACPMLIIYRLSSFSWWLAHLVKELPIYCGLPNLIAQREVVPELLQSQANPTNIANFMIKLWETHSWQEEMKKNLLEIANSIGKKGVSRKIASTVYQLLRRRTSGMDNQ